MQNCTPIGLPEGEGQDGTQVERAEADSVASLYFEGIGTKIHHVEKDGTEGDGTEDACLYVEGSHGAGCRAKWLGQCCGHWGHRWAEQLALEQGLDEFARATRLWGFTLDAVACELISRIV